MDSKTVKLNCLTLGELENDLFFFFFFLVECFFNSPCFVTATNPLFWSHYKGKFHKHYKNNNRNKELYFV